MIILGNVNVLGGFYVYGSDIYWLMFVFMGFYLVLFLFMEFIYNRFAKFKSYNDQCKYMDNRKAPLPEMKLEEFESLVHAGRQLMVDDNYIIDAAPFLNHHPGGKFVVKYNVGRDIGKYMNGSYVMENKMAHLPFLHKPYAHTTYAYQIMKAQSIALLQTNPDSLHILPSFEKILETDQSTHAMTSPQKSSLENGPR